MIAPLLAAVVAATLAPAPQWAVTGSTVTFVVRNAGVPVTGRLGGFRAEIRFDPAALEASSIRATVDTATVKTGIALRDRHLRSCDYFCAEKQPTIVMESVGFRRAGEGAYTGTFELTIRGTKRRVEVPFTFTTDGAAGRFAGDVTIDRTAWGVGGRSMFVANEAAVHVEVEVAREGSR